jgi:hypothetical protein
MAGVVDTTYTFTATDTITSTKMNNILDQSVFTSDALADGTLDVSGGKIKVKSGGVGATQLAADSVTTAKIVAGAVTTTKLSAGKPIWSDWTAASPYISTLTLGDGRTSANEGDTSIAFRSGDPATNTSFDASIKRESGANGDLIINNVVDDTATATNGQIHLQINGSTKVSLENDGKITYASAPIPIPSGTAPIYGVRAWVNFDATTSNNLTGSYSRTSPSTTATITMNGHGLLTGHHVYLDFSSGTADGIYEVTVVDDNTFTITTVETTTQTSVSVTRPGWTIVENGNVSFISKVATGEFIVNFTIGMPSSNYIYFGSGEDPSSGQGDVLVGRPGSGVKTTKSITLATYRPDAIVRQDLPETCIAFLG